MKYFPCLFEKSDLRKALRRFEILNENDNLKWFSSIYISEYWET